LGASPDYDNPTRTQAEKGKAERSGQAEHNGEGELGGLPDYCSYREREIARISAPFRYTECGSDIRRLICSMEREFVYTSR
jgi:hypothetical protein